MIFRDIILAIIGRLAHGDYSMKSSPEPRHAIASPKARHAIASPKVATQLRVQRKPLGIPTQVVKKLLVRVTLG